MAHLTNPYKDDIDFSALALQDADFAKVLKPNGQLDFTNPASVQQLTKSLLKRDFGVIVELSGERLCPPIPNRLNYLLWIQALLSTTSEDFTDDFDPSRKVVGMDVGTGSCCIYPLLACSTCPGWRFVATDVDELSLQFARGNVERNGFGGRIRLVNTVGEEGLFPLDGLGVESLNFTICNPPFYASKSEMLASASLKQRQPFTACTGSESEMVTPGGEVAFVSRMISESLQLRERVRWYSSMLGIFASVSKVVERLKEEGIQNFAVTEFVQGRKTRRWGVAWSFGDWRPRMGVARGVAGLSRVLLPFPCEYHVVLGKGVDNQKAGQHVNDIISKLPMKWIWKASLLTGLGFAQKAVWSRAARRNTTRSEDTKMDEGEDEAALGVKIYCGEVVEGEVLRRVTIRWVKGFDSVLFESFCGMVKRKLDEL